MQLVVRTWRQELIHEEGAPSPQCLSRYCYSRTPCETEHHPRALQFSEITPESFNICDANSKVGLMLLAGIFFEKMFTKWLCVPSTVPGT